MNIEVNENPVIQQCLKDINSAYNKMHLYDIGMSHLHYFDEGILNIDHGTYLYGAFKRKLDSLVAAENN